MIKTILSCFETRAKALITIGSMLGALTTIVTTVFAVDGRYEHTDSAQAKVAATDQKIQMLQMSIDKGRLQDQRAQLENKIFELQVLQKQTDAVKALIARYKEQMRAIDEQLANLIDSKNHQ